MRRQVDRSAAVESLVGSDALDRDDAAETE
jgi:hypothetical protein